ncbi:wax ester/triacylglycerol synthase domain-containing protein [Streptomyces venezuelae]|uniref:wax ester/triacylglycerol synthase domain-containing protein n=1 Tax=Streptomyces venezuelae TaxID=54571 RepID=UPI00345608EA
MQQTLNPIDEIFLSIPRELTPVQGKFIRFRGDVPSLDVLRQHLAERLPALARLTYQAVRAGRRTVWSPSARFDPMDHVLELRLPEGSSLDEALTDVMRLPLPGSGALWDMYLVHGYAVGEYAVCYRVHHGLEDGMGTVHVAAVLFGDDVPATATAGSARGPLLTAGPAELAHGMLTVTKGMVRGLRPAHPWPSLFRSGPDQLAVCSTSATRQELSTLGRKYGGTVTDAFLMALRGALSAWSRSAQDDGAPGNGEGHAVRAAVGASPVPVRMPLSTRHKAEEAAVGNHLATAVVTLPDGRLPTAPAFHQLIDRTHRMRGSGLRPASRALVGLLPAASTRLAVKLLLNPSTAPLYASSYSLPDSLTFNGDPVIDVVPIGVLLPGNGLSVTLLSCGTRVQVSFLHDLRLPDAGRLATLWREALDALPTS